MQVSHKGEGMDGDEEKQVVVGVGVGVPNQALTLFLFCIRTNLKEGEMDRDNNRGLCIPLYVYRIPYLLTQR